jgi:general secretion pathway protein L
MIGHTLSAAEDIVGEERLPEKVLITGSGSTADGCGEAMADYLGMPVNNLNLIQNTDIYVDNYSGDIMKSGCFDNALALAAIEIEGIDCLNFRRGSFAAGSLWLKYKTNFIVTGIILIAVLLFMSFNSFLDYYLMNKSIKTMEIQIREIFTSTFPDVKRIVDPVQQMRIKIQAARKKVLFPGEAEKPMRAIDIIDNISKRIPRETDVTFTRMAIGSENVVVSGDTDTFNSVDNIKSRLEQVDSFKKIIISSANINKSDNRVRFKLKITF